MFPRLLTLLQFTRIALVFTAISNGWAAMLLQDWVTHHKLGEPSLLSIPYVMAMTVVSIGLYAFGMSLNDLIDRRRDTQIAPGRPLPSGRISVRTGHVVCALLGLMSLGGGMWMVWLHPTQQMSLVLLALTIGLIVFYDFAGKYLVAPGLLVLGMVRFFHAAIPAPTLAFPWHAILLLVHVTILSAVCYQLEGKRPRLTLKHWLRVIGGLVLLVGTLLATFIYRRGGGTDVMLHLWLTPRLLPVVAGIITFLALAITLYLQAPDNRSAGRSIMLYGLVWLIVYDASFVFVIDWRPSLIILSLLPLSLIAVQLMRVWAQMVELSAKPQYQRAR